MTRQWMKPAEATDQPYLCVFRNNFTVELTSVLEFEYSADERCQLFLDGKLVACGPERGTVQRYFSGKVKLQLAPGKHCLTSALYCFGKNMTAYGQMSICNGFMLIELPPLHPPRTDIRKMGVSACPRLCLCQYQDRLGKLSAYFN